DFVAGANAVGDEGRMMALRGFRLNAPRENRVELLLDGERRTVEFRDDVEAFESYWNDPQHGMMSWGRTTTLFVDGAAFVTEAFRTYGSSHGSAADGAILAPMPGKVNAVDVAEGEAVAKGQRLVV